MMTNAEIYKTQVEIDNLNNAAPDLLEALSNLVDNYNTKDGDMNFLRYLIKNAEKAIAKAEGK